MTAFVGVSRLASGVMQKTTRELAEAEVRAMIDQHVPRLWRSRAALFIPLVADRLVAFVETVKGLPDDHS